MLKRDLTPLEARVLAVLVEKESTVPDSYPLSANALRTACNQTSSRDPVTDHDERLVETTARGLKDRGLVRIVWSDTGRRTLKYLQTLTEVLELTLDARIHRVRVQELDLVNDTTLVTVRYETDGRARPERRRRQAAAGAALETAARP